MLKTFVYTYQEIYNIYVKNSVMLLFSLFQLALDIEVESKESNRYMDDHMVKIFP